MTFTDRIKKQNFQYIYAVIVDTNEASIKFHKSLGFTEVGHFYNAGLKKNKWLGIVWMNKFIGLKLMFVNLSGMKILQIRFKIYSE